MSQANVETARTLLPIGAVTRMTGVSSHTLRKWESRYGLVTPARTETDRRLYSETDVKRLMVIRELVDEGIQPSHLQGLDDEALMAMRERSVAPVPVAQASGPVLVVGSILATTFRLAATDASIDVRFSADTLDSWLAGNQPVEGAVLLEVHSLQRGLARQILARARTAGARLVVVYGYANRATLTLLQDAGIVCLRAPSEASELLAAASGSAPQPAATPGELPPPQPRRYTDQQIAQLAAISTSIDCECPTHVAQLLSSINAFERYSAECSDSDPVQRELHRYLEQVAATARGLFEDAVGRVAEVEGFEI